MAELWWTLHTDGISVTVGQVIVFWCAGKSVVHTLLHCYFDIGEETEVTEDIE